MPSSGGGHESIVASYLSRAGYRNSDRCKPDILGALHHYPGLKPKIDKFSFNDGRTRDLLCLFGTIPVPYRGSMYNIPVALWILDTHPIHAPLCFVQPTAEMQIRVSSHVDGNGKIYLPYLHEWDGNNSDILGLIQMCIITFGEMPPVFARPAGQPQPAPTPAYPPAYPVQGGGFPYPPTGGTYPPQAAVATPYPPPTSTAGAAYPPAYPAPVSTASESNTSTITQEHVLMSLRSAVEDMVRRRLREEYNMKNVEIQSLTKIKDELNGGQNQLQCAIGQIEKDTITVETAVRELLREEESMKEALQRAKAVGNEAEMSPDEAVMAPTPLYKQLVQAHAEEAAVHEAIYYLGEALKQEVIDCDVFLKQVRKLARKQFFLKATMNKCRHVAGLPV